MQIVYYYKPGTSYTICMQLHRKTLAGSFLCRMDNGYLIFFFFFFFFFTKFT
ncbi:hypothetical protein P175DRAFT_0108290 [Aspergillus ochraceoroseus IBT 24754]|uniref:Uncharacterized protein n=1 Tax=Aspergillus ochraceoroseus IBT 24754 TaxID=1392256 RepID=A0A2T5LM49_9EURO|nr:uncharacterized protein P175DRAFT_0108290 [Aspergillus ochraceoroseus IBT 24754]PTU17361.1 hypothetical protein P175DRAFT_0108290 [Aspergillus ochraceoroseus IBT 24754]